MKIVSVVMSAQCPPALQNAHLCFLTLLPANSMRVGRLSSEHLRTSPLVWKGLPNKSSDSRESRGKEGGNTNSLLLLAEKNFSEVILPKVLGRTCSWLQSSLSCTSALSWGNLWGRIFNWFRDKSSSLRLSVSAPEQSVSGNSSSRFPVSRSSAKCVSFMASGRVLMALLERSRCVRVFKCSSRVSTRLSDTPGGKTAEKRRILDENKRCNVN